MCCIRSRQHRSLFTNSQPCTPKLTVGRFELNCPAGKIYEWVAVQQPITLFGSCNCLDSANTGARLRHVFFWRIVRCLPKIRFRCQWYYDPAVSFLRANKCVTKSSRVADIKSLVTDFFISKQIFVALYCHYSEFFYADYKVIAKLFD